MPLEQQQKLITWLPALFRNAGGTSVTVGVTNKRWFIKSQTVHELTLQSECALLLPLMQEGYGGSFEFAKQLVADRLQEVGLPANLSETFPYIVPVRTAVKHNMGRWVRYAMRWVSYLDVDEVFVRELLRVSRSRSVDQDSRNRAKKKVKEWEQRHGICLIRPL